ncbi:isoprenylcysteine carboxylmethyltransferase family protein [candidate division GN15 bacterium]|uniref:Isoprenylcysteine carboxylmethyltransferase family protein n=1 Tax=candidate division GN15 bacterium TaxID=2072418 RepID=A0A855X7Z2_9BACT|nr:MAG: isoprenylcysteine carboxylmethyltransferase family protein [candidate division GN15 bacterium]
MSFGLTIIIVSLVWIISEILLARLKHSDPTSSRQDKSSLRLMWTAVVLGITAGVLLAVYRAGTIHTGAVYFAFCGLALILIGLAIRWVAIMTLWKYFTVDVSIAEDHKLVTTGLYKYVRHPAYTGSLLSFLGLGLVFSNWLSLLVIVVPITTAFVHRIKVEEEALLSFFGEKYSKYSAGTKRLIPMIY